VTDRRAARASPFIFWGIAVSAALLARDSRAQSASVVRDLLKDALVTGREVHKGSQVDRSGQGFVIFSNELGTVILSAQHVVGSSATRANEDWLISDAGEIQRTINIEFRDGQKRTAQPRCFDTLKGLDISVLFVNDHKVGATIQLEQSDTALEDEQQVFLLAKYPGSATFPNLPKTGRGVLSRDQVPPLFATEASSLKGESGSPWISLRNGRAVAVANFNDLSNSNPGAMSTPVREAWDRCDLLHDILGPRHVSFQRPVQPPNGQYADVVNAIDAIEPVLKLNHAVERSRAFLDLIGA
jgi:hypothetical protein